MDKINRTPMTAPMIIPAIAPELKPLPLSPPPPPPVLVGAVIADEAGGMTAETTEVKVLGDVGMGGRDVGAVAAEDARIGPPEENINNPDEMSFQRFCTSTGASA